MPVEQHEATERTNRPADRTYAYASIATTCWNQNDMRAINTQQDSSMPAAFDSFELIASVPPIEATITTPATPKLDMQPAPSFSDIPTDAPDFKERARQYFADQAQKYQLLADEQNLLASKDIGKPAIEPAKTGAEIITAAEKLGHDPHRWAQTKDSPSPKCNQYVEAVLQACHIPFPWKPGDADCHGMRIALDNECAKPESKWEKSYAYDAAHGPESDKRFTQYKPKDGDVMIWDGPWGNEYVQHSGIVAHPDDLLYAGTASREAPQGWRHGKIWWFTQSEKDYGSPTGVYRYKGEN